MNLPVEIAGLIARGALFVANHSGGKDSQAMLIKLLEIIPAAQILVVHASLGKYEHDGALEHAEEQARASGLVFVVARAVKTFGEMVEHRYKVRPGPNSSCWPSSANRQCTSDLKRGPIEREVRRYAKANGFDAIVSCMGMRAQESPARAKRETFTRNERGTIKGRDWFEWLPIHDLTAGHVFETIARAGQRPHWAYGQGNKRLSCVFCIFGDEIDIANGRRNRPELYAELREIEQRTGYTMHQSRRALDEIADAGDRKLAARAQS
jgi:3'-phosphoadenosine 5'-phosphosulfate sulfotransferase (PAPS reductase)/FAD synthetase